MWRCCIRALPSAVKQNQGPCSPLEGREHPIFSLTAFTLFRRREEVELARSVSQLSPGKVE